MAVSTLRSLALTSVAALRQASVARVQYRGLATTTVKLSDNVNKPTMDDLSDKDKKRVSGGLADEIPTDNKATDWTSHANRPQDSKVPHFVQEVAPKAVEEALPESIHPTGGKPKKA